MGDDRRATDDLIAAITSAEFPPRRRENSYDSRDVDSFLDRLIDACRAGRASPAMIDRAEFGRPPRLRRGYDEFAVDDFLDGIRDRLQQGPARADTELRFCPESLHRRAVWRGTEGGLPVHALFAAVTEQAPNDALLLGCRADGVADELSRLVPGGGMQVLDPWIGEGLSTLHQPDRALDLVCAPWTLHLAADLDRVLGEVAQALRPQGALLATADSSRHLEDLWAHTGRRPPQLPFSRELGSGWLRRHFTEVERIDFETRAVLSTRAEAHDQLAWYSPDAADQLPDVLPDAEYRGHSTLFIASGPANPRADHL